jgi:outer membrane protein assembly factor BamB/tetratricopeptide (TPR) repeat protein
VLALSTAARGDEAPEVVFRGENRAAAGRLAGARKHLDDHKWGEAIEQLQAILNTADNDLVPLNATHSVPARRLCQVQLASLPPEALRLYRQRYEGQAGKKLEQAQADRDIPQLRRLVEEAFCTRAAEKAIDLLGDLAFERGRFEEAEEWWRLLSPLPDARREAATRGLALVYPDPTLKPARLQAKQLLARLFHAGPTGWTAEMDAYRARHGKAEGTLAGRKGRYADLLHTLAEERKKEGNAEPPDWPTFGGDPSRGRVIAAPDDILDRLSALCRGGPTWSFDLEKHARQSEPPGGAATNAAQARSLAFHPIILGDQVLVADARYVIAYDLRSGESHQLYDAVAKGKNGGVEANLKLPAPPDLRYTLTAAGENVYARLGAQDVGVEAPRFGQPAKPRDEKETFLTCLSLRPKGEEKEYLRWQIPSIRRSASEDAVFEGAPLVADGQICIALTRYENDRCITAIECYPVDDTRQPPRRWRREVCQTREPKAGEPRYRHHLLTLAGTQIVYCTHKGAVVAVDALTGRTNWAIRYPLREVEKGKVELRDLAPVLFAEGRLYVAPADSDLLLCLEPATGRTLWERTNMKVVHLLGVGQGRLIFTTTGGLRAVGADDGEDDPDWVVPPSGGDLAPAGRGLLIGDLVLWPTVRHGDLSLQTQVVAIRQRDGWQADYPALLHRLPGGNLAYANGCLVVADRQTLSVFVPPRLLLPRRRAEVRRSPESAQALLALGRAEADAGQTEEAIQTLRQAETKAKNLSVPRLKHLLHEARSERQRILLEMARRDTKAKHWQDAATALRRAVEVPLPPRDRLHALLRAAQLWKDAGQPARARAVWEAIRADEELRQIQVIDRNGKPVRLTSRRSGVSQTGERPVPPLHAAPSLPLFRTWHTQLGSDEWVMTGWRESDPELLLTGSPQGQLTCRTTSAGEVRWRHALPFVPRWAGSHADTILAAGADGIACLHRDDGELLWHFPAPLSSRYPSASLDDVRVIRDPQAPEPLAAFRLVSGRLFFLQGQRRLFAVNAETGAVLWDRWAPGAGLRLSFPQGRFSPCYHAGAETVLVQMAGRRWLLDAATGRLILQAPDGGELWQRPPLELDERTLCVTPDSRHVVLLDARKGKSLWTHTLTGGTTLSGEIPQVLGRGDVLFCVKPANVGYFLQRLDRATGEPIWPQPLLLTRKAPDVSAWTFDREAVYCVEEASLVARSLADGRVLWRRALDGAGGWQARRVGDYLTVWPVPSAKEPRFRFRSPLGAVQWNLGPLLMPEAVFAVAYLDPKTGKLIQRLNLRIESPVRTTRRSGRTAGEAGRSVVVRTSSLLASEEGPVVRFDSPRPMIAAGGEVWGLTVGAEVSDAGRR